MDADGSVTMVRQFRYAFGEEIWELPAGKLEADEDPFEAAKRELSEECGLTADNFIDLGVVYATVGYDSEKIYLWAATGLHSTAQHLDAGEFLDVVKMPFDEAPRTCDGRHDQGQQDPGRAAEIPRSCAQKSEWALKSWTTAPAC